MLRISKLTDYGLVLLAHYAAAEEQSEAVKNAREMAEATLLPYPVVSKILKTLAQEGLLLSRRGSKGGYSLGLPPKEIPVCHIIEALEGPITLMACTAGPGHCEQEATCQIRDPWIQINGAIRETLERITLAELVGNSPTASSSPNQIKQVAFENPRDAH